MRLRTAALETRDGRPLADALMPASARLSVLLQAAALLSHLERAGGWLTDGWSGARVDRQAVLCGVGAADDLRPAPGEHLLADLLGELFGGTGELNGRGAAWRAARRLAPLWGQRLVAVPPDDSVAAVLDAAPFLWRSAHASSRQALLAEMTLGQDRHWLVAGPAPWRRRLLALGGRPEVWREALGGDRARHCWRPSSSNGKRWAAGRNRPSTRAPGRVARIFFEGRFDTAERLLRGRSESAALLLRSRCLLESGRSGALGAGLRRLEGSALGRGEHREIAELRLLCRSVDDAARPAADQPPPDSLSVRRLLPPWRAAGRWHRLAHRRLASANLCGAERALRHAARLLRRCEAPPRQELLLLDLAEVRIRLGTVDGVQEALTSPWTRVSGNGTGRLRRKLLCARLKLVRGEPQKALDLMAEVDGEIAGRRRALPVELHDPLQVLAARALGWLGRPGAARKRLDNRLGTGLPVLEPEEWPALWALSGDRGRALEVSIDTPMADLWRFCLAGGRGTSEEWGSLSALQPYRAARLIYDLERVEPGLTPRYWRRRAAATLRRVGNRSWAGVLAARAVGPWGPVRAYLSDPEGSSEGLCQLFLAAGYGHISLVWEVADERRVLVDGCGGPLELAAPLDDGRLQLRAERLDPMLRTLFVLALRDLRMESIEASRERRSVTASADGPVARMESTAIGGDEPPMIGESRVLRTALDRLRRLAAAPISILILGQTGTGKELAAASAHSWSRRRTGPFLAVNCAALSESLVQSDLFGHARGAFTGADRDRMGVFETASGGTVFLDEIGDLPAAAQGLLLRVLQEKEVRRVGENRPRSVDVRVVAATHHDLEAMVEAGTFRRDLYFRLAAGRVELPPLALRGNDILLLAERFLGQAARAGGQAALALPLPAKVRRRLLEHSWPGNVRELQNVLAVAAALAGDGPITCGHLELPAAGERRSAAAQATGRQATGYHQQLRALRRRLVEDALAATAGNRAGAARRLGLSRQAISYLANDLNIV